MDTATNILIFSLVTGSQYALVVLGYSLIYSVLGFMNFAHGDLVAVGAYIAWVLSVGWLHLPFPVAAAMCILFTGLLSLIIGRLVLIPANRRSGMTALVTAIGLSMILQSTLSLVFSGEAKAFRVPVMGEFLMGLPVKKVHLFTFALAIVLLGGLWFGLLKRTNIGLEMRACACNPDSASRLGLRRERVFGWAFFISGAFAAVAGLLKGMDDQIINPSMGFALGIRAFAACLVGSIGSLGGAVAGAFLLGFAENGLTYLMVSWPPLQPIAPVVTKDAVALLLLVGVLAWKPRGLFAPTYEPRP
jgi:branched-chain amino acid transport system permease protein